MNRNSLMMSVFMAGVGVLSALGDSGVGTAPLLDASLVSARVIDQQKSDTGVDLVLKIEDVFYGEKGAKDKTFTVHTAVLGGHGVLVLGTTPQIGESSLWEVFGRTNIQAAIYEMQKRNDVVQLPLFEHEHEKYETAKEWAHRVRAVSELEPVKRFDALKDVLAATSNKVTQAWVIRLVGEHGNQQEIDFLKEEVLNNRMSLYGQLAADEVLCSRLGKQWSHSELRVSKVQEWVSSPLDQATELRFITRLDVSSQQGEITAKQLNIIKRMAKANSSISPGSFNRIDRMNSRNQSPSDEESRTVVDTDKDGRARQGQPLNNK